MVKKLNRRWVSGVALNQIGQLNFNKAFIGMNELMKISIQHPDMEEGAVKRAILENAIETYILADASKSVIPLFVKVAPYQTC